MESVEDHGYIVDIGINGTKAFLPKKAAKDKHHPEGMAKYFKEPIICKEIGPTCLNAFSIFPDFIKNFKSNGLKRRVNISFKHVCAYVSRAESGSVCDFSIRRSEERRTCGPPF